MIALTLKLDQLRFTDSVEIASSKVILEAIQRRAEKKWGEKWLPNLAREYARIAQAQGAVEATYESRRRSIYRVFEVYSCHLETAILLAAAVGCRFQMACASEITVEEF